METTRNPSTWRRLFYLSFAGAALAATSALQPAEAGEAPCGKYDGLKCTEVEWCFGAGGNKVCGTKVVSYYHGEEPVEWEY